MPNDAGTSSLKVAVIGSGLSAVGAIKALKKRGINPVVLDWGQGLEEDRARQVKNLGAAPPGEWKVEQRAWLNQNETVNLKRSIPKKLVFGSTYFYGTSRPEAPVEAKGNLPAWDCRNTGAGGSGATNGSTKQTGQPLAQQPGPQVAHG